jgi:hypothetical protein
MTNLIEVYFGKGEYAITSANVERLVKHAQDYIEQSIWKWSLQDNLGFQKAGTKTKRFEEAFKALENVSNPSCQILRELMVRLEPKAELKCRVKSTPEAKEAKRAEMRVTLEAAGISAVEIERMVKAL